MNYIINIIVAILVGLMSILGVGGGNFKEILTELVGIDNMPELTEIFEENKDIFTDANNKDSKDVINNGNNGWHFEDINYYEAKGIFGDVKKDIKVAVIDTGIDCSHPALNGSVVYHYDAAEDKEVTHSNVNCAWNEKKMETHGTHVAGIIAGSEIDGVQVGIANGVSLYDIKALNEYGSGDSISLLRAIEKAMELDVDVINMSIGSYGFEDDEYEAVREALEKGIVIVASSGNESIVRIGSPAEIPGVISVNATGQLGLADFSNYGWSNSISAPGENIFSSVTQKEENDEIVYINANEENGNYQEMSGTSMATPIVTGAVAMIKSYMPDLSAEEIKNIILKSAKKDEIHDQYIYGNGKLDLYEAALQTKKMLENQNNLKDNIEYFKPVESNIIYRNENSFFDVENNELLENQQFVELEYKMKDVASKDTLVFRLTDEKGMILKEYELNMNEQNDQDFVPNSVDSNYDYYDVTFLHTYDESTKIGNIKIFYNVYIMDKAFDTENIYAHLIHTSGNDVSIKDAEMKIVPSIEAESEIINIERINATKDTPVKMTIDVKYPLNDLPMEDKNSIALIAVDSKAFLNNYTVLWEKDIENSYLPIGELTFDFTITKEIVDYLDAENIVFVLVRGNFKDSTPKVYDFVSKKYIVLD